MNVRPSILLALTLLAVPAPLADAAPQGGADEVLVTLRPGVSIAKIAKKYRAEFVAAIPETSTYSLRVGNAGATIRRMKSDAKVRSAGRDRRISRHQTGAFPFDDAEPIDEGGEAAYRAQLDAGPLAVAGVKAAADLAGTGSCVVAVLDTGVDSRHPGISSHFWTNRTEANGIAGIDDDLNGVVDDVNGADFLDRDGNPDEIGVAGHVSGHGTFIAGLVALVAPGARVMPVRVLDGEGRGTAFRAAQALVYAVKAGSRVVVMSFGTETGEPAPALRDAIAWASSRGVLMVAAAGNDASEGLPYPASDAENVISVGAASDLRRAPFSNYDTDDALAVWAPGEALVSALPGALDSGGYAPRYGKWSGTSFATGVVAGTLALAVAASGTAIADRAQAFDVLRKTAVVAVTPALSVDPAFYNLLDSGSARLDALGSFGSKFMGGGGSLAAMYYADLATAPGAAPAGGVLARASSRSGRVARQIVAVARGLAPRARHRLVGRFEGVSGDVVLGEAMSDGDGTLVVAGAAPAGPRALASARVEDALGRAVLSASFDLSAASARTFTAARLVRSDGITATREDAAGYKTSGVGTIQFFASLSRLVARAEYALRVDGLEKARAKAEPGSGPEGGADVHLSFDVSTRDSASGSPRPPAGGGLVEVVRTDTGEVVAHADLSAQ